MRKLIVCGVVVGVSFVIFGFIPKHSATYYEAIKPEVQEATRKGAKAKIIYRVVDDEGAPITNTNVRGTWRNDFPRKTWDETFVTNTNGEFVAKGTVGGAFGFFVRKEGYYLSSAGLNFHWRPGISPVVQDGKWQPYGEHRTIVVKRKKKPVEMMLHKWGIDGCRAPVTNTWFALDMELGQWCPPYGEGRNNDALIRFTGKVIDDWTWDVTMEVSFTNMPYAGFYELSKDSYSGLKCCYEASTNNDAYARRQLVFRSKVSRATLPGAPDLAELPYDKYLVFRTRTKVDAEGKLISAHYGKIYGEWRVGPFRMRFGGNEDGLYFNPSSNDPNLEDLENVRQLKLLGQ